MKNNTKKCYSSVRILATGGILALGMALSGPANAAPAVLFCKTNPDFFTNRCTIHVDAITRKTDGVVSKGHLVSGQSKSYSCINKVCTDNVGGATKPFDFAMTDLPRFCSLLFKNPPCSVEWK